MALKHGQQYIGGFVPTPIGDIQLYGGITTYAKTGASSAKASSDKKTGSEDEKIIVAGNTADQSAIMNGYGEMMGLRDVTAAKRQIEGEMSTYLYQAQDPSKAFNEAKGVQLRQKYQELLFLETSLMDVLPASAENLKKWNIQQTKILEKHAQNQLNLEQDVQGNYTLSLERIMFPGQRTISARMYEIDRTPKLNYDPNLGIYFEEIPLPTYYEAGSFEKYIQGNVDAMSTKFNKWSSGLSYTGARMGNDYEYALRSSYGGTTNKSVNEFINSALGEMGTQAKKELFEKSWSHVLTNTDVIMNKVANAKTKEELDALMTEPFIYSRYHLPGKANPVTDKEKKAWDGYNFETGLYQDFTELALLKRTIEEHGHELTSDQMGQIMEDINVISARVEAGFSYIANNNAVRIVGNSMERARLSDYRTNYTRLKEYGSREETDQLLMTDYNAAQVKTWGGYKEAANIPVIVDGKATTIMAPKAVIKSLEAFGIDRDNPMKINTGTKLITGTGNMAEIKDPKIAGLFSLSGSDAEIYWGPTISKGEGGKLQHVTDEQIKFSMAHGQYIHGSLTMAKEQMAPGARGEELLVAGYDIYKTEMRNMNNPNYQSYEEYKKSIVEHKDGLFYQPFKFNETTIGTNYVKNIELLPTDQMKQKTGYQESPLQRVEVMFDVTEWKKMDKQTRKGYKEIYPILEDMEDLSDENDNILTKTRSDKQKNEYVVTTMWVDVATVGGYSSITEAATNKTHVTDWEEENITSIVGKEARKY